MITTRPRADVRFFFSLAVRPSGPELEDVKRVVKECLELAGIGAKTRKGYGLMEEVKW